MTIRLRALAPLAVCMLCFGAGAAAQAARGTIAGDVVRADAQPVFPATVILVDLDAGEERRAVTDAQGTFVFGGLVPGRYQLRIEERRFLPWTGGAIVVAAGDRQTVTIQLVDVPAPRVELVAVPDRWALAPPDWQRYARTDPGEYPYAPGRPNSPYRQQTLKGDRPAFGRDVFVVLTMTADTLGEYRNVPGDGTRADVRPVGTVALDVYRGSTAFRPRDWAVRIAPALNRRGVRLQDAYAERRLADVGSHFDVVSLRAGIQPFTSDFRGFLMRDTGPGLRLFGSAARNRHQWNVALFDRLHRDRDNELTVFDRRRQQVFVANSYHQDVLLPGYTVSPSLHVSREAGGTTAYYAGLGGDGHWGAVNVTHQAYGVFGRDLRGSFAALEASIDRDWHRVKVSVLYASGDDDAGDGVSRGFDAIAERPNFAGGTASFWNRQALAAPEAGVTLVGRRALLPSMRRGGAASPANFDNPGLVLGGAGWDADWTRRLRSSVNANVLRFATGGAIGVDYGAALRYRPMIIEQVAITAGVSVFTPSGGFRAFVPPGTLVSPFAGLTLIY